ncbi:MAG: DNA polymerase Y family protein [Pseudomonadota bacterium]|nr:DNA polymerase Y family protein [Pseudomonadota bacterium]
MNGPRNRLWLALRIRDLPLSALEAAASGDEPLAVAENRTLVYSNRAAEAAGITRGMDTTTAQLLGGCRILPRDRHREQQALEALRDQLYRFSPHIDIHHSRATAQSGLRLELSSCLRLFSGLQPLWQAVMAELAGRGHDTRWGLAHTPMGAWLLSFARHGISGDETPGCFIERLNRLPVQVLQDHPQAVAALLDMGFATLGDIARQIQSSALASFRKRLGGEFAAFIADLYDIDRDFAQGSLFTRPLATHVPEEIFHERVEFEHPASLVAHLQPAIETLLQRLADFLRTRQLACQRIRWQLADIHRRRETIEVRSDLPQHDWRLLYDLSIITFDNRPIPFEVDSLALDCIDPQPRRAASQRLDFAGEGKGGGDQRELPATLAKLKARLGEGAVHKVGYRDSLAPELSQAIVGLGERCLQQLPDAHRHSLRPAWLFSRPIAIAQRGQHLYWHGHLTLAVGPERLVGHWWEDPLARDYYLAQRSDNAVLWVYRDLRSGEWYVHGIFG